MNRMNSNGRDLYPFNDMTSSKQVGVWENEVSSEILQRTFDFLVIPILREIYLLYPIPLQYKIQMRRETINPRSTLTLCRSKSNRGIRRKQTAHSNYPDCSKQLQIYVMEGLWIKKPIMTGPPLASGSILIYMVGRIQKPWKPKLLVPLIQIRSGVLYRYILISSKLPSNFPQV